MIGGWAWLYHKAKQREQAPTIECAVPETGLPYGYVETLSDFLRIYFPDIKIFRSCDKDVTEVWLPENPKRIKAEEAVDRAHDNFKP